MADSCARVCVPVCVCVRVCTLPDCLNLINRALDKLVTFFSGHPLQAADVDDDVLVVVAVAAAVVVDDDNGNVDDDKEWPG